MSILNQQKRIKINRIGQLQLGVMQVWKSTSNIHHQLSRKFNVADMITVMEFAEAVGNIFNDNHGGKDRRKRAIVGKGFW